MNPQPLTNKFAFYIETESDTIHYFEEGIDPKEDKGFEDCDIGYYRDHVRAAVEGLRLQFAALSGFEASQGNIQSERAYDNALKLLDEWFPAFADEDAHNGSYTNASESK